MNENTAEVINLDEERQKREIIPAKPDSTRPTGPNWLSEIPQGWGFLCRQDHRRTGSRTFMTSVLQKVDTLEPCTLLWDSTSKQHFWVHTNDFSLMNEWLRSIPVVPAEKEDTPIEEVEDGDVDRTNST